MFYRYGRSLEVIRHFYNDGEVYMILGKEQEGETECVFPTVCKFGEPSRTMTMRLSKTRPMLTVEVDADLRCLPAYRNLVARGIADLEVEAGLFGHVRMKPDGELLYCVELLWEAPRRISEGMLVELSALIEAFFESKLYEALRELTNGTLPTAAYLSIRSADERKVGEKDGEDEDDEEDEDNEDDEDDEDEDNEDDEEDDYRKLFERVFERKPNERRGFGSFFREDGEEEEDDKPTVNVDLSGLYDDLDEDAKRGIDPLERLRLLGILDDEDSDEDEEEDEEEDDEEITVRTSMEEVRTDLVDTLHRLAEREQDASMVDEELRSAHQSLKETIRMMDDLENDRMLSEAIERVAKQAEDSDERDTEEDVSDGFDLEDDDEVERERKKRRRERALIHTLYGLERRRDTEAYLMHRMDLEEIRRSIIDELWHLQGFEPGFGHFSEDDEAEELPFEELFSDDDDDDLF